MLSRFSKSSISFLAPDQKSLLEEANLPVGLVDRIAGQSVLVETYPEEPPATRLVEPDDFPLLIDPNGDYWNDYRPVRVLYSETIMASVGRFELLIAQFWDMETANSDVFSAWRSNGGGRT